MLSLMDGPAPLRVGGRVPPAPVSSISALVGCRRHLHLATSFSGVEIRSCGERMHDPTLYGGGIAERRRPTDRAEV